MVGCGVGGGSFVKDKAARDLHGCYAQEGLWGSGMCINSNVWGSGLS